MAPLTAEELLKHPEYDHTIWDLKPERKGKVSVAKDRGGPIDIAYEALSKLQGVQIRHIRQQHLSYHCSSKLLASRSNVLSRFVSLALVVSRSLFFSSHLLGQCCTPYHTYPGSIKSPVLSVLLCSCSHKSATALLECIPLTPCSGSWALVG
jgi:hypothetical protein